MRTLRRAARAAGWILLGSSAIAVLACSGPRADELAPVLRERVQAAQAASGDYGTQVAGFYAARDWMPVWTSGGRFAADTLPLLETLCRADGEGLDPADYDPAAIDAAIERALAKPPADNAAHLAALTDLETSITRSLLRYLDQQSRGRYRPGEVGGPWRIDEDSPPDLVALAQRAVTSGTEEVRARLAQRTRGQTALLDGIERYRKLAEQGGWPQVPAGAKLELGATGESVLRLRERLAATGDLAGPTADPRYDDALAQAVARFQTRHGLEADGVVAEDTLAELNAPVEERIRQMLVNLERLRWLPERRNGDVIFVNIPDFRLQAFRAGKPVLTMRVVVGKRMNQTPVFADQMTHVIFRPYWNVPESIAVNELLPKLRDGESRDTYEVVDAEEQVADSDPRVNEEDITSGRLRLRQPPGPGNALGLVKFMLPNQFDVYLHDTPADSLFDRNERDFSHGCVRVEHPAQLAEFVLGWPHERVSEAMQGADNQSVQLERPLPVQIVYLTAWADDGGIVQFRRDVYGHDAGLARRIAVPQEAGSRACRELLERAEQLS